MTMEVVVVFPTTHLTLKAEKVFEREHIAHRTVMKPRKISSDCGLAIRIDEKDVERCREAALTDNLKPVRFFREAAKGWECFLQVEDHAN